MLNNKVILNIGCGKTRIPSSIGVDKVFVEGYVNVVHDLNLLPYPFENNYADEIHMYHVLEHLNDPLQKVEELHRILKPGGILYIRVPHFSSMGAFSDITHIRPFGYASFDCFIKDTYHHFYTKLEFNILNKQIKYFGTYPNEGVYARYVHPNNCLFILKPIVRTINWLIKLSPTFFERIWCYWVGGAIEVVVTLQKK